MPTTKLNSYPKTFLTFLARRCWKLLKYTSVVLLLWSLIKIPWIIAYRVRGADLLRNEASTDILNRRAYLIDRYRQGSMNPSNMPQVIGQFFQGEWAIGTCSMTAAALTNIAFLYPDTRAESLDVIDGLAKLALTNEFQEFDARAWGESPINSLGSMKGHIGYLGHLNLILLARRLLGGNEEYDSQILSINEAFQRRIKSHKFPLLETYPGEIYTSDNAVVYAGLELFGKVFNIDLSQIFERFVEYARSQLLDPQTSLVRFAVDANGDGLQIGRGSGTGWNSFYFPFFDKTFAAEQYQLAKKHLSTFFPFGFAGLREAPRGVSGYADIDSGPVILGQSTSGTGFIIAGARHANDREYLDGLLLTTEIAGTSIEWNGLRRYLFAPLVGDAIVLAMKTATDWDTRFLVGREKGSGPLLKN